MRVSAVDVSVAADALGVDLDEDLLLFLQARDVSLCECAGRSAGLVSGR